MNNPNDHAAETLAETENFSAFRADEPDGETVYYLQLGRATLNFFTEEWDELLAAIPELIQSKPDDEGMYAASFDNVDIWMDKNDWTEFTQLMRDLNA
ncbi:MAG: hypothetical protein KPEEDBHJ_00312 [Anaerolineales bacterium]|nr:hypothetical protein [Anaerolineales bacterium]